MLELFFAVTIDPDKYGVTKSLFKVSTVLTEGEPAVTKIAGIRSVQIPVGARLTGGRYVLIEDSHLTLSPSPDVSLPSDSKDTSVQNTGNQTGSIIGLFSNLIAAQDCFRSYRLKPWDRRWDAETDAVLLNIDEDHSIFKLDKSLLKRLEALHTLYQLA